MPLINVKVIEGVFSSSQRREIVQKLTDAMVSIEGENMRGVTWCVLEEVHSGDWAIGGNALRRCLPDDLYELYLDTSRASYTRHESIVLDPGCRFPDREPADNVWPKGTTASCGS